MNPDAPLPTPPLDFLPLLPELILLGFGVIALIAGTFVRKRSHTAQLPLMLLTLAGFTTSAAASILLWNREGDATVLGGMIGTDRFSVAGRLIILAIGALGAVLAFHYFSRTQDPRAEFWALLLFSVLGMTLIVAAADLIVVFLALEILSLSLYVMTAFGWQVGSTEAAMKYFLLGAFSSAFFLFGVSFAYGASGSTNIGELALSLTDPGSQALALVAAGFLLIGFGFKVSLVPFHMWTPDVYQGAPTSVTAFMAAGTKVAAFLALTRVFTVAFQPLTWDWRPVIVAVAVVSMVGGSILAIAQTDVKRMLAYSSVAHAGFILTGLTSADQVGIEAVLYYLVAYAVSVIGAFGVVMLASGNALERSSYASFRGLAKRSPVLAGLLTLFLLSLSGIPPTVGFVGKVGVFSAAVGAGYWWLAMIGVLASAIAAFFYLRVVVMMYMQEPEGDAVADDAALPRWTLAVPAVLTLVLGVFPGLILGLLEEASILRW
ncbi:MAG: NADH-quinone oxidoreductase subunit N [Actinomycetota bacterium]